MSKSKNVSYKIVAKGQMLVVGDKLPVVEQFQNLRKVNRKGQLVDTLPEYSDGAVVELVRDERDASLVEDQFIVLSPAKYAHQRLQAVVDSLYHEIESRIQEEQRFEAASKKHGLIYAIEWLGGDVIQQIAYATEIAGVFAGTNVDTFRFAGHMWTMERLQEFKAQLQERMAAEIEASTDLILSGHRGLTPSSTSPFQNLSESYSMKGLTEARKKMVELLDYLQF